jgi:hypothetical protein
MPSFEIAVHYRDRDSQLEDYGAADLCQQKHSLIYLSIVVLQYKAAIRLGYLLIASQLWITIIIRLAVKAI